MLRVLTISIYVLALSTMARADVNLSIRTHVAGEAGFKVSSHLILGPREAILVDAQFTRSEARQVVAMIKESGRRLRTVLVTHGHPDHYFGLEIITAAFPGVRVVASPAVIQDIQATGPAKLAYWKPKYGEDLTDQLVIPQTLAAKDLELDGVTLEALEMGPGESEHTTVLYVPGLAALVTGDLAFNRVHLWLVENRPAPWLRRLSQLQTLSIAAVYPGHGEPGSKDLLETNAAYIRAFVDITTTAPNQAAALAALVGKFPTYALPIIAQLSVDARMKP
jgi:glyoxylase-like metal-dependent hydrolase (beta-lactamase superfamily II)